MADFDCSYTKALGMEVDLTAAKFGKRSKRYTLHNSEVTRQLCHACGQWFYCEELGGRETERLESKCCRISVEEHIIFVPGCAPSSV